MCLMPSWSMHKSLMNHQKLWKASIGDAKAIATPFHQCFNELSTRWATTDLCWIYVHLIALNLDSTRKVQDSLWMYSVISNYFIYFALNFVTRSHHSESLVPLAVDIPRLKSLIFLIDFPFMGSATSMHVNFICNKLKIYNQNYLLYVFLVDGPLCCLVASIPCVLQCEY